MPGVFESCEAHEPRASREARDRAAARTIARRTSTRSASYASYESYLDGLFTYCLSILCDHDAATAALRDALALAERRAHRGPGTGGEHRAWLYALARWACLRKLAETKQKRQATHAAGRTDKGAGKSGKGTGPESAEPALPPDLQERRHRELTLLAWPEAAGTTPEQREALELAVRHHLTAPEVAAVLGVAPATARDLLATAACEVERTRAALAVVESGGCPSVAHLTGDSRLILSTALRRELVRHVDDCPRCRRSAERAAPGRWPGTSVTPAELPVLEAPRTALAARSRAKVADAPRFDRRGFPMDPRDRAARRDRLRARAVTTTVVATVVAAPVLALWAAYRGAPTGEPDGRPGTAREDRGPDAVGGTGAGGGYENAGSASVKPGTGKDGEPDVSVEVTSVAPGTADGSAGSMSVTAANDGDTTLITLTATGPDPVRWSAATGSAWLYLSRSAGTLAPGGSVTLKAYVDHLHEPRGAWQARISIAPAGAVVTITGSGPVPTRPTPTSPATPAPTSPPTSPPPAQPTPSPTPTDPPTSTSATPTPTPTDSETPTPTGS
ncbi:MULTISPECIES: BACON domain-containing protein [unclassified Streptomyces]|uniref:BACON domain-containing protein n=1 Tax=unclassified Streptomyces TaxID=2593676 RepID=UPI003328C7CB